MAQRTALVTGANRGIGLEVCRQLAAAGLRTVLAARDREKAERAQRTLGLLSASSEPVQPGEPIEPIEPVEPVEPVEIIELDVTDARSIERAVRDVQERIGSIDVLVNNAAVLLGEHDEVLSLSMADLRLTFETNVFGAMAIAAACVPAMIEAGYGRVVNVSSMAGQLASMGTYAPAYSMSKAALNAFTRQLAAATNGTGVLVNSACPGWVRTDMGGPSAPRSVEQGADTIVWLATLPVGGATGKFFSNRKAMAW